MQQAAGVGYCAVNYDCSGIQESRNRVAVNQLPHAAKTSFILEIRSEIARDEVVVMTDDGSLTGRQ